MKILPDYLIQVLPELEDAIEELRLSIVDHAYELLQCLDLDELSIDQIRQKLELCELKVSNMTSEWLPNGRFYRLYQSIKHNRSRKNAIKAIAKSGGQFEGLWSNNFSNKTEYNYNKIQVARHYELSSNADGYFFVSGDTVRDKKGTVITSAAKALTTDILINQSLPAGYTYLYIPWPRPHYPADSACFYNVNMLMYDRLHYSTDCEHKWTLYNQTEKIYYCADNSYEQRFCKVTDSNTLYGNSASTCYLPFDNTIKSDCPFVYDLYSEDVPASTKYDWYNGKGTPWHAPYWFDYHYMNKMGITLPDENSAGTWPITESGTYYDIDDDPTDDPSDAITYKLNNNCSELSDSKSYFPTKCYMRDRLKSTMPNRLQKFEFKDYNYIKIEDSKRYYITLESYEGLYEKVVSLIYSAYNYQISRDIIRNYINTIPVTLPYFTKYGLFNNAKLTFENRQAAYDVQCNFSYREETIYRYVLEDDASIEHSIDSNEYIVPYMTYSDAPGTYRCDVLHNGTVLNIHESLHHSKIYRPFWCENTPWSEMISSKYKSDLELSDGESVNHSLYNWLHLKQISNRPQLTQTNGDNCPLCVGTIEYNKPPVSCITFYSEHRPTHSTLDNIYLAFATPYADGDHAQKALSDDLSENVAYYYGSTNRIEYDPELYYTIITINGDTISEVPVRSLQQNQIRAYIEGNPATGEFNINRNSDTHDTVEYYTYKTSTVHKLWFSENHDDVLLDQTIYLYNSVGSTELGWFSENTVNLTYNVIGIFKENGITVPYSTGILYPEIIDHNYVVSASSFVYNNNPVTAAYVLFTVHASDGAIPQFDHVQLNKNVTLLHGSLSALYIDLGHVEYHDAPLPPPVYGIPMGGMMSPTGHSTYYVQELPGQITVDNIILSGFMVPMSVENTAYGNPNAISQNIVINDNDVNGILYDANGKYITDQSKLYGVKQLFGIGNGSVPATVTADGFPTSAGDTNEDMQFHPYGSYLYDSTGNKIYIGNNATVISAKVFLKNGKDVTYQLSSLGIYNGYLYLYWSTNYTWIGAYKITYTVDIVQSFTDLDTLRQMGLVSTYFDNQGRLRLKFSCAGTGITFNGSMDSVLIIAATKQQMTVDNIGLHGMVGPMGGIMTEYVPLPTVSTTWLSIGGSSGNVIIVPNEDHVGYWWDSDSQSYISADWDSNVTYGIIALYTTPFAYSGRMELEIKEVSGTVGVRNVSSSSVTVCQANIAICSSSSATVITVYDSSNNPYNAFKYTSDGTDYYYVLDGTQTDWTNDLSSIGYKLPPTIITLYMVPDRYRYVQPNVINTSSPNSSYCYQMYTSESGQDDSTKFIPDSTKNYINGYYSSETGEWIDSTSKYNVSQMPDSTGGDEVELRQVLEDGRLWLGTNKTSYWYTTLNLVRFRVADKL